MEYGISWDFDIEWDEMKWDGRLYIIPYPIVWAASIVNNTNYASYLFNFFLARYKACKNM